MLCGASWAAFGSIFWCLYLECSPKGLLEPPGFDFGSILVGFGGVWGTFWEGLGRVLEEFGVSEIGVLLERVF